MTTRSSGTRLLSRCHAFKAAAVPGESGGFHMKRHLCAFLVSTALGLSLAAAQAVQILHRFKGPDGSDPQTALPLGADARLYGTTLVDGRFGRGTVFAIDPATGKFNTLHHLGTDEGLNPLGQLLLASDGYFYGTTRSGGDDNVNCYGGCGTIYRIAATGKFRTLHFMILQEGATLQGGLIEGPDGRLYSTATQGGTTGCGTVYAFAPARAKESVLHTFNCDNEGRFPYGRLVLAGDGFLYVTLS